MEEYNRTDDKYLYKFGCVTVNCKIDFKIKGLLKLWKLIITGFSEPTCRLQIAASKIYLFRSSVTNQQRFMYTPIRYSPLLLMQSLGNNFISNNSLEVDYWFRRARSVVGAIFNETPANWPKVSKQVWLSGSMFAVGSRGMVSCLSAPQRRPQYYVFCQIYTKPQNVEVIVIGQCAMKCIK